MAILVKQIKPKRLQEDAMHLALLSAMHVVERTIKKDYEETTATWKHKVKFESLISLARGNITVYVDTSDKIYGYVNSGTKEHDIWAGAYTGKSKAKVLAFPSAFTPKTKPGSLKSSAGHRGRVDTFTPYVQHPGTEARNFDGLIEGKRRKWYKTEMEKAMREARKVSGNAI